MVLYISEDKIGIRGVNLMKKDTDIIGLSVLSVQEGLEIGIVERLLVDKKTFSVVALALSTDRWYEDYKVLNFKDIIGMSEELLTIEQAATAESCTAYPNFEALLANTVELVDSRIVSKTGKVLGEAVSYTLDEAGHITEIDMLDTQDELTTLLGEKIFSINNNIIIINE